jgi:xanthine dehydrogenase accessory factor
MSNRALIDTFNTWRQEGQPFALATVTETAGSTYSKAGRHLLIKANGEHAGLLSGGCLEGDLADHARDVIHNGVACLISYDMRDDADDLWGIGLGCNGMMHILLQRLDAGSNWQPFHALAAAMAGQQRRTAALVIASDSSIAPLGASAIADRSGQLLQQHDWSEEIEFVVPDSLPAIIPNASLAGHTSVLYWAIEPWPRLLLLGAGPDAVPIVNTARLLGWEVTVADHRPHYIDSSGFENADIKKLIAPVTVAAELPLEQYDAIVVLSHHLETDRIYLQQLAAIPAQNAPDYLGILGPAARKQKLLDDLDGDTTILAGLLRGPVGLDLGASNPETIALSLISEIQLVLQQSSGLPLGDPADRL